METHPGRSPRRTLPSPWILTSCGPCGGSTRSSTKTWHVRFGSTRPREGSTIAARAWWRSVAVVPFTRRRSPRNCVFPKVILPLGAGVLSALGLLVSPLSFEVARSDLQLADGLGAGLVRNPFHAAVAGSQPPPPRCRHPKLRHSHHVPVGHALPRPTARDRGDAAGFGGPCGIAFQDSGVVRRYVRARVLTEPSRCAPGNHELEGGSVPAPIRSCAWAIT